MQLIKVNTFYLIFTRDCFCVCFCLSVIAIQPNRIRKISISDSINDFRRQNILFGINFWLMKRFRKIDRSFKWNIFNSLSKNMKGMFWIPWVQLLLHQCYVPDLAWVIRFGVLDLYSLSGYMPYCQISLSSEAARLIVVMIISLWYLTGISAALLLRCLSYFGVIGKV